MLTPFSGHVDPPTGGGEIGRQRALVKVKIFCAKNHPSVQPGGMN